MATDDAGFGYQGTTSLLSGPDTSWLLPASTATNELIWKQWMKSHFVEMQLQIPIYYLFYFLIKLWHYIGWFADDYGSLLASLISCTSFLLLSPSCFSWMKLLDASWWRGTFPPTAMGGVENLTKCLTFSLFLRIPSSLTSLSSPSFAFSEALRTPYTTSLSPLKRGGKDEGIWCTVQPFAKYQAMLVLKMIKVLIIGSV